MNRDLTTGLRDRMADMADMAVNRLRSRGAGEAEPDRKGCAKQLG